MFSVVRLRRVIVVVVSAFALVVPVTGASAAPPPDKAITTPTYTPTNSIVFNNPKGKNAQKRAIITQIDKAIDATPPGGTIRMAQYLFTDCPCCMLFRGMVVGVAVGGVLWAAVLAGALIGLRLALL